MGVTGDDTLVGDMFFPDTGADLFIFGNGDGTDTIIDFTPGVDQIGLVEGELVFEDLTIVQDSSNTLLEVTATGEVLAVLNGVDAADISADSFVVVPDVSNPEEALALLNGSGTISFDDMAAGDIVTDQIDGLTVSVAEGLDAMIFDSANPTGGDDDLFSTEHGNVLIISENGNSANPDDNAAGGSLMFDWDGVVGIDSIGLLDIEESGGTITLFGDDDTTILATIDIPALGDNIYQSLDIGTTDVGKMDVLMTGSGAVTEIILGDSESVI
jgi:hypothetical protein